MKRTNTFAVRPLSDDGERVLRDLLDASRQQIIEFPRTKDFWTMRPNVEITHTLQGRIKDFAEERDLTLSEAYTELLEAGLDTLGTQDQQ